ncbi:NAD-dependent epimerase/dehydratase family protein [Leeia sp.]|uniref:NAD-dependent epimerase/dehydratase family protein n=1 Tax=Leeia sp. TaxID=2884678 RepID=UPI0035B41B95
MKIAILGATSQLARDFVAAAGRSGQFRFSLYARRPHVVQQWIKQRDVQGIDQIGEFSQFGKHTHFDALMNFVGVGDPATAQRMGASILDTTYTFDTLALDYLSAHPQTRYIFISSGAAYGSDFTHAATEETVAQFKLNSLNAQDWYGTAKFYAECRHRALADLPIVDIRVFSYFSHTQDISARFLVTDMLRAVRDKAILQTSPDNLVRDFLHPADFFNLTKALLAAPAANTAVDCYTQAPVDKFTLLSAMQRHLGLQFEVVDSYTGVNATGSKSNYYSLNKRAAGFGYQPSRTSLDGVLQEAATLLAGA